MSIGSRIKECREKLGITQEELATLLGVSKGAIGNYEAGIGYPKVENMTKLFTILKTDANFLFQDEVSTKIKEMLTSQEREHIHKYRQLDDYGKEAVDSILNVEYKRCTSHVVEEQSDEQEIEIKHSYYKVSAGTGFTLGNDDEWETISIPDTNEARKADFALTIQGNSMEPVYYDGDIVLVKEQPTIDVGQVGIFTVDGEGYIKKYGGDRLVSLNAEYDDIIFAEHDEDRIRCVGKVIGRV